MSAQKYSSSETNLLGDSWAGIKNTYFQENEFSLNLMMENKMFLFLMPLTTIQGQNL